MKLDNSAWLEASSFLRTLGYEGNVLDSPEFQKSAEHFLEILLQKNQEVNLTGAKDKETLFWKHLVDSLSLLAFDPNIGATADWGCGGGFPGIPLALARKFSGSSEPVIFVDSIGKKVKAVQEFCAALELENTEGFIGRGEDLIRDGKLRKVNTVVMRAVAPPERAIKWMSAAIPSWIFFLGPTQLEAWKKEERALSKLRLHIHSERSFALPREMGERCLLRISKRST